MSEFLDKLLHAIREKEQEDKFYSVVVLSGTDGGWYREEAVELHPGNAAHDSYSVSKSVTAMGMGLLYDKKLISPADTLEKWLGEYFTDGTDDRWRRITLDQLLRHCTGAAEGVDFDVTHALEWEDPEWLHTLFSCPITGTPGQEFVYSDGNFYIAARIIEKICGMDSDAFIQRHIFTPLLFHQNAWSRDGAGHTLGGTGLYMRTEDMAKLGWLCMNGGVWDGKRIFSAEWTRMLCGTGTEENTAYGYGIPCMSNGGFASCGMLGQGYYFNPRTRHVCAWHSHESDGLSEACCELDV